MLCATYKTRKKQGMYLYVPKKGHFDDVPEELMNMFGSGELVTILALDKHDKLANVDKQKLVTALTDEGYYLQMPPKEEDLLVAHRKSLGLSEISDKK